MNEKIAAFIIPEGFDRPQAKALLDHFFEQGIIKMRKPDVNTEAELAGLYECSTPLGRLNYEKKREIFEILEGMTVSNAQHLLDGVRDMINLRAIIPE